MCAQSAHERLSRMGIVRPINLFTVADDDILRAEYNRHADLGTLQALASRLGRTKSFIVRRARMLGLTIPNRRKPYLAHRMSMRSRDWHANNPHPKGMLGKHHSDEFKKNQSDRSLKNWVAMSPDRRAAVAAVKKSWKASWREIDGKKIFLRSTWEANYARYLSLLQKNGLIASWEHEPRVFVFEGVETWARSYLPDFLVVHISGYIEYHEVKGWMDARSYTKLRRMQIFHPDIKVIVIDRHAYDAVAKKYSHLIEGWE